MQSFTIQIPQPCHERWNDMQPTEQGRFCASCQKTVVDYTALSDQELIQLLAHASETSCGRFRNEQLNRPLIVSNSEATTTWRQWIGLLAFSLFGWQTARAQQNQASRPSQHSPVRPVSTQPTRLSFSVTTLPARTTINSGQEAESIITGRVMTTDSSGNLLPVPDAYVFIQGERQTHTDSLGTYKLLVPTRLLTSPLTIRAVTMKAARGKIEIDVFASTKSIVANDIILEKPGPVTIITTGGIALIPAPSFWQKLKYKLFHARSKSWFDKQTAKRG